MFDNSIEKRKLPQIKQTDLFQQAQKLLEKTLQEFTEFNKSIYA